MNQINDNEHAHIVCGHCEATVRVPMARIAERPRCPRCRQALFSGHPVALRTATFDQHLTHNDVPVIVDFWAPWCGPCQAMAPRFEAAAQKFEPRARFGKVNSDDEPGLSTRFGIRGIPTLIAFRRGREVARQSGALDARTLEQWVESVIA